MASWRDTATQEAQDDLDGLVNVVLPFAQKMLQEQGEFFPFGATVSDAGEVAMLAGKPDNSDRPSSVSVIEIMVDGARSKREGLRAVAVCADVRLNGSDAIRVGLEHRDGQALAVYLPYKKKRFGRGVEIGSMQAGPSEPQVWA